MIVGLWKKAVDGSQVRAGQSPRPYGPSQSAAPTALPKGEPSRARCPQRAALAPVGLGGAEPAPLRRGDGRFPIIVGGQSRPPLRRCNERIPVIAAGKTPKRRPLAPPSGELSAQPTERGNANRWIIPFRSPYRPSQSPSVTALPEGEPSRGGRLCPPLWMIHSFRIVVQDGVRIVHGLAF